MAIEALKGGWVGHSFNVFKHTEESHRAGVDPFGTAACQIGCVNNAIYQASEALTRSGVSEGIPIAAKGALYLTPILTNYLSVKLNFKDNPSLKKLINLINDNLSLVCQVAVIASSIALIAIGQTFLGAVTLGFLGFELAQSFLPLPLFATKSVSTFGFFMSNFARFALGDIMSKIAGVLDIASYAYDWWTWASPKEYPLPILHDIGYGIDQIPKGQSIEINSVHLEYRSPVPKAPVDADIALIKTAFDQIDWTEPKRFALLRKKVTEDPHWQENYGSQDTDDQILTYITKGVEKFVSSIKNRTLKKGEVLSYESIVAKSKYIASRIEGLSVQDQVGYLMELGLVANYCPGGYARGINQVYLALSDTFEQKTLPSLVYKVLEFERKKLFESVIQSFQDGAPKAVENVIQVSDVHYYNAFLNFFGEFFHLQDVREMAEDPISFISTFEKAIYHWFYGGTFQELMKQMYTEDRVGEAVELAIREGQIPYNLLRSFFDEEARAAGKDEQWVNKQVYNAMDGRVRTQYVDYLLTRLGVFQPATAGASA